MLRRATAHFPARHCAQALGFGPNYTSFRTSVVLLPPSGRSHATGSSGDKVIYDGFDLHFLGTSSGGPTRGRSANATLLTWNGHSFLFDCGEGTLRQFMHLSNPPMRLCTPRGSPDGVNVMRRIASLLRERAAHAAAGLITPASC